MQKTSSTSAYPKEEREKNKSLLLATLNYLLEYHSADMVFDDYSPSRELYKDELRKTELDIQKYRSQQIKKRLDRHTALLKHRYDQGFNNYIKEKTGYDIDIFEGFKAAVMPTISRGSIDNNDIYPIEHYLKAYGTHPKEREHIVLLQALLKEWKAKLNLLKSSFETITIKAYSIQEGKKSRELNEAEYQEFVKQWLISEDVATNGVHKLSVECSGKGKHALTYVNISLGGGTGGIYGAKGERLPIKAYWKDDHHVIIETKKEYETVFSYSQVSSYGELIKIEYF